MSSIRSILEKYGREVYLYTNSANQKELFGKSLDQALLEIQEIINECKPGSAYVGYDDNPQELHENRLYNSGIDQYQSNLEKRLK